MKIGEVIPWTLRLLKAFNPRTEALETYLERTLPGLDADASLNESQIFKNLTSSEEITEEDASKIILMILTKVYGRKNCLEDLARCFLDMNRGDVSRKDFPRILVLLSILCFQIKHIKVATLRSLLINEVPEKILLILEFVLPWSIKHGKGKSKEVREVLEKFYDPAFIDNIFSIFESKKENLTLYIDFLRQAGAKPEISLKDQMKARKKNATKVVPFKLTERKLSLFPEPMAINTEIKANPVPESLYKTSLKHIEKAKEERRDKLSRLCQMRARRYRESDTFTLHETKDTLSDLVKQKELEVQKMLNFKFKARNIPAAIVAPKVTEVPQTAATLLREESVFRKQQEKEYMLLKEYQGNLRDSRDFRRWQESCLRADREEEERRIEKRKDDAEKAFSKAKKASYNAFQDKQKEVEKTKKMRNETIEELNLERKKILEEQRLMVIEQAKRTKDALESALKKDKESKAAAYREEKLMNKMNKVQLREFKKKNLEKNIDRRKRVQAMICKPKRGKKKIDPTYKPNLGLLEQMSMFEMKKKLSLREEEYREQRDLKHNSIKRHKQEKEKSLQTTIKNVKALRNARKRQAEQIRLKKIEQDKIDTILLKKKKEKKLAKFKERKELRAKVKKLFGLGEQS